MNITIDDRGRAIVSLPLRVWTVLAASIEKKSIFQSNASSPQDLSTVAARKAYLSRALTISTFISIRLKELQGLVEEKVHVETKVGPSELIASFRAQDVTADSFTVKTIVDIANTKRQSSDVNNNRLPSRVTAPATSPAVLHNTLAPSPINASSSAPCSKSPSPSLPSVHVDDIGMGFFSSVDYNTLQELHERSLERERAKAEEQRENEPCFGFFTKMTNGQLPKEVQPSIFGDPKPNSENYCEVRPESRKSTSTEVTEDIDILKDVPPESFLEGVVGVDIVGSLGNEILYFTDSSELEKERFEQMHQLGKLFYFLFSRGSSSLPPLQPYMGALGDFQNHLSLDEDGAKSMEEDNDLDPNGRSKRGRKVDPIRHFNELRQVQVPYSICRLIFDLLKTNSLGDFPPDTAFFSFHVLLSELESLKTKPEIFLDDVDAPITSALKFRDVLYGRDNEVNLIVAVARCSQMEFDSKNHFVMVSGCSGSGKTRLVDEVKAKLLKDDWVILTSTFEQFQTNHPLATIFLSVEEFFLSLVQKSNKRGARSLNEAHRIKNITESIQNKIPLSELAVLSDLIPSLLLLVPNASSFRGESLVNSATNPAHYATRLRFLLRMLICAISSADNPVLLFFDDAQWGDEEFIKEFVSDSSHLGKSDIGTGLKRHLCFVCCYRDDLEEELSDTSFVQHPYTTVTKLQLQDIPETSIHDMVSETLSVPRRLSKSLASIVYLKSAGNPLFAKSFLDSMVEEGKVYYSVEEKRWIWDTEAIRQVSIDDNVAKLLVRKLQRLPSKVQDALKLLSCFGQRVPKFAIVNQETIDGLNHAFSSGLLDMDAEFYKFTHSAVQSAAHDLIPETLRAELHFKLGCSIIELDPLPDERTLTTRNIVAIDQINKSRPLEVADSELCRKFAELNLFSGRQSMQSGGFESALNYFEHGLSFLGDSNWKENYHLTLELSDNACLASYITTKTDLVEKHVTRVLSHARDTLDMLNAYSVHIRAMCASGFEIDAIQLVLQVSKILGEDFVNLNDVSNPDMERLAKDELFVMRQLLDELGTDKLLKLGRMTDVRKCWIMKLMSYVMKDMFRTKPLLMTVLACRMIKLSIDFGTCEATCIAFVMYSVALMDSPENVGHSYHWGKFAMTLFQTLDNPDPSMHHRVKHYFLSLVGVWIEPHQSICECLHINYRNCEFSGDIETSSNVLAWYCLINTLSGSNLVTLNNIYWDVGRKMAETSQHQHLMFVASFHGHIVKLANLSSTSMFELVKGPFQSEDELLDYAIATSKSKLLCGIYFMKLYDAFWSREYAAGVDLFTAYFSVTNSTTLDFLFLWFYGGIMSFGAARQHPEEWSNYLKTGEDSVINFRKWTSHSEWNCQNKLYLLEAEHFNTLGQQGQAKMKYELAIQSSQLHRFGHEEGLSYELYGTFWSDLGQKSLARENFSKAVKCYEKWGAKLKIDYLKSLLSEAPELQN